jgi:hypothetical protein
MFYYQQQAQENYLNNINYQLYVHENYLNNVNYQNQMQVHTNYVNSVNYQNQQQVEENYVNSVNYQNQMQVHTNYVNSVNYQNQQRVEENYVNSVNYQNQEMQINNENYVNYQNQQRLNNIYYEYNSSLENLKLLIYNNDEELKINYIKIKQIILDILKSDNNKFRSIKMSNIKCLINVLDNKIYFIDTSNFLKLIDKCKL